MLLLIELIDIIRMIIVIMNKGSRKGWSFYWLLNIIFPPLNGKRLIVILLKKESRNFCQLIENDKDILSKIGFNKEIKEKDWNIYIFISLIHLIFIFILLYFIDIGLFYQMINQNINDQFDQDDLDEDVLAERISLMNKDNLADYPFVSINIVKKYPGKDHLALNHLTFHVEQGECFGLLGFNGAGKFLFL